MPNFFINNGEKTPYKIDLVNSVVLNQDESLKISFFHQNELFYCMTLLDACVF